MFSWNSFIENQTVTSWNCLRLLNQTNFIKTLDENFAKPDRTIKEFTFLATSIFLKNTSFETSF